MPAPPLISRHTSSCARPSGARERRGSSASFDGSYVDRSECLNAAPLLRLIELHAPTILLDELDTLFKGDRELAEAVRGILNSGFDRAGAVFIKNVPTTDGGWDPRAFSTYGPKVLSGLANFQRPLLIARWSST